MGDKPDEGVKRAFDPLVRQVVDSWCTSEDPMRADLDEAARAALEKAVTSYDVSGRSVPFAVYAMWWMRQAVMQLRSQLRSEE